MRVGFAAVLAIGLGTLTMSAQAAEKRVDRTFAVTPGGRLTVDASGADITVRSTDRDQVVVHALIRGSESRLERMRIEVEQHGNDVIVTVKRPSGWSGWFFGTWEASEIDVQVPRSYNVDLSTSGGDLLLEGVQGDVSGKTSGGDIRVVDVRGPTRMNTSGGDIRVERSEGNFSVHTSGGDIDADDLGGGFEAKTSGGDVHVRNVDGPVVLRTSGGNIIATDIRGDAELGTSGNDIRAVVDGKIVAHTSGGSITAELIGRNRGVRATSSGGDIVLRMSKDVRGELYASTGGGSVRSELPVTTSEFSSRKIVGTLNGGGEEIQARTSGGTIRLLARE
jgi:DUF4097 and DUF4098 domain-containing protein YvlB